MKQLPSNSLLNISPIDGRYKKETEILSNYFSEYAYIKNRVLVEVNYLYALSELKVIRKINKKEEKNLENIFNKFSINDAKRIKKIEEKTKHDVKAIEYFIREKLSMTSLKDVLTYIHFGLTSEDTNNIAVRLMLKDANINVVLPELLKLNQIIFNEYKKYKKLPMLARTHGQPAVPTTLGKEFLVFQKRLEMELVELEKIKFKGKLNGAVGNYNALKFTYPKINWKKFSKNFLKNLGLDVNLFTTQIASYEDIIFYFQTIQRVNGILLDLNQDMWRYISDGYFIQLNKKSEVGSSTMPQKINPINFENSEGNIIIANSLIDGFINKLPVSRLQRDLSGSTISRNFGIALAHSLLSYKNTIKGISRIKASEEKILTDLNSDWSILSEAVQIYLRKEGVHNAYELLKKYSRGKKLNETDFHEIINNLPLNKKQKNELKMLTPVRYYGII